MKLTEELRERRENSAKVIPAENYAIMQEDTKKLLDEKLSENAAKKGDRLPYFELPDQNGNLIKLDDLLQDQYLIVSFYRGGWCPYCNMELRALQQHANELKELGAAIVAITPETPDNSLSTAEKSELKFKVLSDNGNAYAKKLNLVFQMSTGLQTVYNSFGIDVVKHNGNSDFELPMPATYVVDNKKNIVYDFVPEDYTQRLDPEEILAFLRKKSS